MSKSSEEVLSIVKYVKNKKTEGVLYMMGERMAWMVHSKDTFSISYNYADIRVQKISPDTKEKVQLQIVLHDGTANTFHFVNPKGKSAQQQDREGVKELLQQLLPKFRTKVNSELEEKNRMLQDDPDLFQLYKDLVVSGVVSAEEFWANRTGKSTSTTSSFKQDVGVSAAFLADIKPQTDGCNGLKYNLTADIIQSIFRTYPAVRIKHLENVPDKLSEQEFWTRFFQSHYFHRDRINLGTKDIFSDCAKSDDLAIATELEQPFSDPFLDLTRFSDDTKAEGYGSTKDVAVSALASSTSSQVNASLIKRFNQHSTMVLKATCDSKAYSGLHGSISTASLNGGTGNGGLTPVNSTTSLSSMGGPSSSAMSLPSLGAASEEPPLKKSKMQESISYASDLATEGEEKSAAASAPALTLANLDRYLHGPTPVTATTYNTSTDILNACQAVAREMLAWRPALGQCLSGGAAVSVLGELTPGGALMQGHANQQLNQLVPVEIQQEVKQLYLALAELLRHFWSCFPVTSKTLEEKLVRMRSNLERFQQAKLQPLQQRLYTQSYTMHLTTHLDQMIQAAFSKFNMWQAKKLAKGKS